MTHKDFKHKYIDYYTLLEEDFVKTFNFVMLEKDNYETFSNEFMKQILSIGSEIDILKKFVAKLLKEDFDSRRDTALLSIKDSFPDITNIEIKIRKTGEILKPWDYNNEPNWWTVYNKVKHNRLEKAVLLRQSDNGSDIQDVTWDPNKEWYKYANLGNTLLCLSALFSLELIAYRLLALQNGENVFVPYIHSIFCINNLYWEGIIHGNGLVFMNGGLHIDDE